MRLFVLHVVAAHNHGEILRDIERFQQRCNKRRRFVGHQPQRNALRVQRAQRFLNVREQETALLDGLFIETIEQFAQNPQLFILRDVSVVNARFTLRGTLRRALLTRPRQRALHQDIGAVANPRYHALFSRNGEFKGVQRLVYGAR